MGLLQEVEAPGTLIMVLIFFAFFAVTYILNWVWLSGVWHVS